MCFSQNIQKILVKIQHSFISSTPRILVKYLYLLKDFYQKLSVSIILNGDDVLEAFS